MLQEDKLVTLLSDLIKINNDRIEGYKIAKDASDDADVKALFQHMINDSVKFVEALNQQLAAQGVDGITAGTISGKIYRTWMSVKTIFTGTDRYSLFSSCEYGEDAVQRAYADALSSDVTMPYSVREMIASQRAWLKEAHDTIKSYRDVVS
ncbi:MAG: PA2169 family four-helix-bundle protein [Chitinophaga sp.]|uniref:PA2169 family four-helix-bundle protein n=1 Tax=Chitinophaga sp. TaxID=1869181 RepID=UPI001B0C2CDF|nr:PA2169 family four-helix-bundle protein [Chitinophaga sp.]MBO9728893.1 PA2169 family four-helix-bundle protein [Chitinophaga sp.]